MMDTLETARLRIRAISADDLERVFAVHNSNPDFLRLMEGSESEAGRYDMARWQRDWHIAQLMPGRHMLACYLKTNDEPVGYAEYLEEHDDGYPWFGVLSIHKEHQRQGLGSEAYSQLAQHFRADYGWSSIRCSVLAQNVVGIAFARHVGFRPIKEATHRLASGEQTVVVFEGVCADLE